MADLGGIPVSPENEPPVADDSPTDTGREGDIYEVPAVRTGSEDDLTENPRMAVVGRPDGETKLSAERAGKRYLPEGQIGGPDNRAPAMIDGPACRDTDSDRARIHSPGYTSRMRPARWRVIISGESPVPGVGEVTLSRIAPPGPNRATRVVVAPRIDGNDGAIVFSWVWHPGPGGRERGLHPDATRSLSAGGLQPSSPGGGGWRDPMNSGPRGRE